MIGEYLYYFGTGEEVNHMFLHKKDEQKEDTKDRKHAEKIDKSQKLSHEAAARIMDIEWKHHPGGG